MSLHTLGDYFPPPLRSSLTEQPAPSHTTLAICTARTNWELTPFLSRPHHVDIRVSEGAAIVMSRTVRTELYQQGETAVLEVTTHHAGRRPATVSVMLHHPQRLSLAALAQSRARQLARHRRVSQ